MSIRKRKWTNKKGVEKEAWITDYVDGTGVRRQKTFEKKKDADRFAATAKVEIRQGTHVADSASATVKEAGDLWVSSGQNSGLERSTVNQRKRHMRLHIEPFIGETLLSKLNVPAIRFFEDQLRHEGRSQAMLRKVLGSLGAILADAQERGLASRNPVRDIRGSRRRGKERQAEKRRRAS